MRKLLITDLDNTLYDWVTFFTQSFRGMAEELVRILETPEDHILSEFRTIHQRYGNSEQPFAVLELPSLHQRFPDMSPSELARKIDPALHRFNSIRKRSLALYPGVAETLDKLVGSDVRIVGHTEAIVANSYWRIKALGIEKYFSRLYTLEGKVSRHRTDSVKFIDPPEGFVTVLPRKERKPNPAMVADICKREGVGLSDAFYVGDSMVRDISMARRAGVKAIWARYGSKYDPTLWTYLVRITHWTDEDVRREKELKEKFGDTHPDHSIDNFSELYPIVLGRMEAASAPQ